MKPEGSEQEEPMMRPQSEAEGLEAPWRVPDINPCSKAEESRIWLSVGNGSSSNDKKHPLKKSLAGTWVLLPILLLFHSGPQLVGWCCPHSASTFPAQLTDPRTTFLWGDTPSHTQKCALPIFQASLNPNWQSRWTITPLDSFLSPFMFQV
jgi:hypothetical protein